MTRPKRSRYASLTKRLLKWRDTLNGKAIMVEEGGDPHFALWGLCAADERELQVAKQDLSHWPNDPGRLDFIVALRVYGEALKRRNDAVEASKALGLRCHEWKTPKLLTTYLSVCRSSVCAYDATSPWPRIVDGWWTDASMLVRVEDLAALPGLRKRVESATPFPMPHFTNTITCTLAPQNGERRVSSVITGKLYRDQPATTIIRGGARLVQMHADRFDLMWAIYKKHGGEMSVTDTRGIYIRKPGNTIAMCMPLKTVDNLEAVYEAWKDHPMARRYFL
jgi:hypothetical protein